MTKITTQKHDSHLAEEKQTQNKAVKRMRTKRNYDPAIDISQDTGWRIKKWEHFTDTS